MTESESKEVLRSNPDLLKEILEDLEELMQDSDHMKKISISEVNAALIWQLLAAWCGASDECQGTLMNKGILTKLGNSLESDVNKFYKEIFYSSTCLWHLILAENGKFKVEISKDTRIVPGNLSFINLT